MTNKLLSAVVVMQVVILLTLWVGSPVATVQAQVPDAGRNAWN